MRAYSRRLILLTIGLVGISSGIVVLLYRNTDGAPVVRSFETIIQTSIEPKVTSQAPQTTPTQARFSHYDVLISSYMNSGSRFTGRLFGFRKDAFYFYEPLWRLSVWDYYHGDNTTCSSTIGTCRVATSREASLMKSKIHPLDLNRTRSEKTQKETLLKILSEIYSCNLVSVQHLVHPTVHDNVVYSGPSWDAFRTCVKGAIAKSTCLEKLSEVCRNAKHRVTKVLRLTIGTMETLLQQRPNLKIIHLLRDPRGIINSRKESQGYPLRSNRDVTINSVNLCRKMRWDIEGAQRLKKIFPKRFKLIFYEDLKSDVHKMVKRLYDFVGMTYDTSEVASLNIVKVNNAKVKTKTKQVARETDNANWWRNQMLLLDVLTVQRECQSVFRALQLEMFSSENQLKNLSLPYRKTEPFVDFV